MSKKHQQFILAAGAAELVGPLNLQQGFNITPFAAFHEATIPALAIRQRLGLESNPNYLQLLPYLILRQQRGDTSHYLTYRRGAGVGEARLAGNLSIGFGGHIDLCDVVSDEQSHIRLTSTLAGSAQRELAEEVELGAERSITPEYRGLILDISNEVGRVHLGIAYEATLPREVDAWCREEELETLGWKTAAELLDSGLPLENWTRIYLQAQQ